MANFLSTLPKYGLLGMVGDQIEEEKEDERRKKMLMEQSMGMTAGMKRGGRVKKFAKGGSMDDLAPRSNLPTKNAKQQAAEAKKKDAKREAYNDLTPRENLPPKKYAKGGSVRGDGCCSKGKTKGRMR